MRQVITNQSFVMTHAIHRCRIEKTITRIQAFVEQPNRFVTISLAITHRHIHTAKTNGRDVKGTELALMHNDSDFNLSALLPNNNCEVNCHGVLYRHVAKSRTVLNEYLTTRELAELLRIKERKVYDLASSGAVPCSRATGKLLFPRDAIENWIAQSASGSQTSEPISRANVILGSHDPLLEWAIRESRCGLASYFDSSLDGLSRFAQNKGIASGLHIFHAESGDWNYPAIESKFQHLPVILVEWAYRQRGIIFHPEKEITQLKDLSGQKVVPRQAEAGSQVLLETLLNNEGLSADEIDWLTPSRSEVDAVLAVQEGKADATFGLASIAAQYNLGFVPIIEERFDLLVDRRAWFEPAWQALLTFCHSPAFKSRAEELVGYRVDNLFSVRFNGG